MMIALKYHNDALIEWALSMPEPTESLAELIKQRDDAIADYERFKEKQQAARKPYVKTCVNEKGDVVTYVDYDQWEKEDPKGCMEFGMASFNGFSWIDTLEEKIDIKICHLNRKLDTRD